MPKGFSNSNKMLINTNFFMGGISTDPKLSIPNSFYQSQSLDFRTQPSQMNILPAPRQISGNMSDLVTAMEQDLNGVRWGIGDQGNLYKISTSDVISNEGNIGENGTAGLLYNQVTDQLYIPGRTKVSMFGQVTTGNPGQPRLQPGIFAQSSSINNGTNQLYDINTGNFDGTLRSTASSSFPIKTILSEDPSQQALFSPDIEPGYSISPFILLKGTGDWTLTLHDVQNNPLASVTVVNAKLVSGQFNEFVFGKQVRVLVGGGIASGAANYHFHLTSTVADGTVQVVTANATNPALGTGDLMSLNFLWSAYRLVDTSNGWHPTALFNVSTGTGNGQSICIGNGQYLSTYNFSNDAIPDNNSWVRHQLVFKAGYEVCGLSTNNQYLVIAVERRSKNPSRNFQDGALYFWDGTTAQPNFIIDIPMGAPYGLYTFNNVSYFVVAGSLFAWSGGQTVIKVRKLAYQNTDYLQAVDHTVLNPNMFTSRYNILMMGYPTSTTNQNITSGVWSWGTVELQFPNSLGLSYVLSNGQTNSTGTLKIGCNQNFVDSMYTSWQYTDVNNVIHYGMDLLDNYSSAATSGSWTSLIYDGAARFNQKTAARAKVSFTPLPAGATVTPFYILDRGNKVLSNTPATAGATNALIEVNTRCHEIQYGFNFTCLPGTFNPESFTGVTLEIDGNSEEVNLAPDG